jgi:hypothetical protein
MIAFYYGIMVMFLREKITAVLTKAFTRRQEAWRR